MKKGIIVTSFGTTHEDTRKACIQSIENLIKDKFKDYVVIGAFTSRVIISRLKKNQAYLAYNPTQALEQMRDKGIKDIYIQPLLIIEGHEYDKILKEIEIFTQANNGFDIKIGKALLADENDYHQVIRALNLSDYGEDEALVLMGHGTDHQGDRAYDKLQTMIRAKGYKRVFIGTLEGSKTLEDILLELKMQEIRKVSLKPFMLVAGSHAKNDMVSDRESSWKSILEKNKIEVKTQLTGLGENQAIQKLFAEHLKDMI